MFIFTRRLVFSVLLFFAFALVDNSVFGQSKAYTRMANRITYRSASLNGLFSSTVTCVAQFDYGTDTNALTTVDAGGFSGGSIFMRVVVKDLTPGAVYYFRARVQHATIASNRDTGRFIRFIAKSPANGKGDNGIQVTDSGIVYTWGPNTIRQLGDSTLNTYTTPIRPLKGEYPGTKYFGDDPNNPIIAVASGVGCYYALAASGLVYAWGEGANGRLGLNSTIDVSYPRRVAKGTYPGNTFLGDAPGNPIIAIVAGPANAYALGLDGRIYAWGKNNEYQLGDSTTIERRTPVLVRKGNYPYGSHIGTSPDDPVLAIAAGERHVVVITASLCYGWGTNTYGALGTNNTTTYMVPTRVLKGSSSSDKVFFGDNSDYPAIMVAAGIDFTILYNSNGRAYGMGLNNSGQLGDISYTNSNIPVLVGFTGIQGRNAYQITCTDSTSYLMDHPGLVYSWGSNFFKNVGDSGSYATANKTRRVVAGAYPYAPAYFANDTSNGGRSIEGFGQMVFGMTRRGELYGWGRNDSSNIANGNTTNLGKPNRVLGVGGNHVMNLINTRGTFHLYAPWRTLAKSAIIKAKAYGWENNTIVSIEYGMSKSFGSSIVLDTLSEDETKLMTANLTNLTPGTQYYYRFKAQSIDGIAYSKTKMFASTAPVICSQSNTYFLNENGTVLAQGYGLFGQIGNAGTINATKATPVSKGRYQGMSILGDNPNDPIVQLAAGAYHVLALTKSGLVFSWGYNANGELGDSSLTHRNTPVQVVKGVYPGTRYLGDDSNNPIIFIAAGSNSSYAIAQSGQVYSWGDNGYYQLGNKLSSANQPSKVLKGTYPGTDFGTDPNNPIIKVFGGGSSCYALDFRGNLYSWGDATFYQLGDSTNTTPNSPIKPKKGEYGGLSSIGDNAANGIEDVAASKASVLVLTALGEVYGVGANANGQLAKGVAYPSEKRWVRALEGEYAGNTYLGDKENNNLHQIFSGPDAFSYGAIAENGLTFMWGYNNSGGLGDSSTTDAYSPKLVKKGTYSAPRYFGEKASGSSFPTYLSVGQIHSAAVLANGLGYAWGNAKLGELGSGSLTDQKIPVNCNYSTSSCGTNQVDAAKPCNINNTISSSAGTYDSYYFEADTGGWIHYCDCDQRLLLSLNPGTSETVIAPIGGVGVKLFSSPTYSTTSYGGLITNNKGYSMIYKMWEVSPIAQPKAFVGVKFYFTDAQYDSLVAALARHPFPSTMTSIKQMNFYKTKAGTYALPHTQAGYSMQHGTASDTSTWKYAKAGSHHSAEFKVKSFSGGGGGGGGGGGAGTTPLPLTWISAKAWSVNGNDAAIQWQTATEDQHGHFYLQRSLNGIDFELLKEVKGLGRPAEYTETDLQARLLGDVVYYRVVYINEDHEATYSDLMPVRFLESEQTRIAWLAPNPFIDQLQIQLSSSEGGHLMLFDVAGKIIQQHQLYQNQYTLDLSSLPAGIYFLSIDQGKKVKIIKM